MTTIPTDFQRPEFDADYEDAETSATDKKTISTAESEACCDCVPSNTSVCNTENDMAHFIGSSAGYFGAFWFK